MRRGAEVKGRDALPESDGPGFDEIVGSGGAIRGPFGILLHSPELARRAAAVGGYLRYESAIEPRLRETAVMATAGLNECAYEWAAHEPIARSVGVPASVIDAIRARRPADLEPDDRDIYELAVGIIQTHRVPQELFERLKTRLGLSGLVEVVAAIGYRSVVASPVDTF